MKILTRHRRRRLRRLMLRLVRRDSLPKSRIARVAIGLLFVLGGSVGFLPVVGFWMVPVGLTILAVDVPFIRPYARRLKGALRHGWIWLVGVMRKAHPASRRQP